MEPTEPIVEPAIIKAEVDQQAVVAIMAGVKNWWHHTGWLAIKCRSERHRIVKIRSLLRFNSAVKCLPLLGSNDNDGIECKKKKKKKEIER